MSYLVLARKYRPKNFHTLVGQEHVVRALTHALEQQRLHHAYLFTGTRGVGKTTLSRILAKSFNCEQGITANPCGVCEACVAIDAGRFVDYIEMDAASNRGVDEMAQLLEQAIYAPSNARFKVYMIDEVHMLTNHAFNSMLKTLEEPPAHVKFILATTDPQKIPVTVLSRCLQFNLKQMPLPGIVGHLENILNQEQIQFELPALRLLAQGAQGSMRDALSLTDQAIAYAAGTVSLTAVQAMLGALDQTYLIQIVDALVAQDATALMVMADNMAVHSWSYKAALQDLATLLHQLSIAQFAPSAIAEDLPERAEILRLANLLDEEQVQLFYQIAVHGRNELSLAPDEYAGFSMTLLRMLAFRPITSFANESAVSTSVNARPVSKGAAVETNRVTNSISEPVPVQAMANSSKKSPAMAALAALTERRSAPRAERQSTDLAQLSEAKSRTEHSLLHPSSASGERVSNSPLTQAGEPLGESENDAVTLVTEEEPSSVEPFTPNPKLKNTWDGDWPKLVAGLTLRGVARELAHQSELIHYDRALQQITFKLRIPLETLLTSGSADKLTGVLKEYFAVAVKLEIEIGAVQHTAHAEAAIERAASQDAAEFAIKSDALVQGLINEFGATIVPGSIKSVL